MNKSALLNLFFFSLLLTSGSLFAAEQSSEATEPDSSAASKIEAAKRQGEVHAGTPERGPGNPIVGKQKAFMCKGCHNKIGYKTAYPKVYEVPKLGGQHAEYLTSALYQYKNGERQFTTMQNMAAALSDQDIADIAAYYSSVEH